MKTADLLGGGAGIAFGAYVLFEGSRMPPDLIMKIGPSFFPDMLASGLIFFSSLLVIHALLGRAKGQAEAISLANKGIQRALFSLLAIVCYGALLIPLGFPLTTVLLVSVIMALLGKRQPLEIAAVSVITTLTVWLLFAKLLKLSMPMGILESLL